jgi:hypothetical protein
VLAPDRLLSKARVVTGRKAWPRAGSVIANIPIRRTSLLRIRLIPSCAANHLIFALIWTSTYRLFSGPPTNVVPTAATLK